MLLKKLKLLWKFEILFLFMLPYTSIIEAQNSPNLQWDKTIGGTRADFLCDMIQTSDEGFLFGGYSNSQAGEDKSEQARGWDDYWVVRTDKQGNIRWNKTYGGNRYDRLDVMVQAHDGGYLLLGRSNSDLSGEKTEAHRGNAEYDFWLLRIDEDGNKLWDKTYGGNKKDMPTAMLATSDGAYLLAGVSYSDKSGEKSEESRGEDDYWVIKVDANGNILWDKTFGGRFSDELSALVEGPDGHYYLGGTSFSGTSEDKTDELIGQTWRQDFWIIKLGADGNKIWDKSYGSAGYESLSDMVLGADQSILLAGSSFVVGDGDRSVPTKGGYDYWVLNIDLDGEVRWDNAFGTLYFDFCTSICKTSDGSYLIAGNTDGGISSDKSEINRGRQDYWIVKIDQNGQKSWDKTLGGNQDDELFDVLSTLDDGVLIGGSSSSELSGDKTENVRGDFYYDMFDFWVTKLQADDEPVFQLINTQTEEVITELIDGQEIDLSQYNLSEFGIIVSTYPDKTQSVQFDLNGPINLLKGESAKPFSLFGDQGYNDIKGQEPVLGSYTLTTQLYTESGQAGENFMTRTRSFSFIQSSPFVFKLVDADTDIAISNLIASNTIDIYENNLDNFNIWVSGTPSGTQSVEMIMEGNLTTYSKTESVAPYALFGDDGAGDFFGSITDKQILNFTVKAYSGPGRSGELLATETFSINFIDTRPFEFALVDADKDVIEFNIQDGQEIDLQRYGISKLGFLGRGFDDATESIRFELIGTNGLIRTESNPPYSLYGDAQGGRDIQGEVFEEGTYTLRAMVYAGNGATGELLGEYEVSFTIANTGAYPTKLWMIDSELDQPVVEIIDGEPLLINLDQSPLGGFSFDLTDYPPETSSVKYELSGPITVTRTESAAPYTLFGDGSGGTNYFGQTPVEGDYTLKVSTFDQRGGGGTVLSENTYQFSFVRDVDRPVVARVLNPLTGTGDQIGVILENSEENTISYQIYFQNQTTKGVAQVYPGEKVEIPVQNIQIPKGHMYLLQLNTGSKTKIIRLIK